MESLPVSTHLCGIRARYLCSMAFFYLLVCEQKAESWTVRLFDLTANFFS